MASFVYKTPLIYETVMRLLYGQQFNARYEAIASCIPDGATVLDVCCGPPVLFKRFLREKSIDYTGIDINARFVAELRASGAKGILANLAEMRSLPAADYVVMQASLYHFLPDPSTVVDRMLEAARKEVVISEPIRNLSSSKIPVLSWFARVQTNPGAGEHRLRFDEQTLDAFFARYGSRVTRSFLTPGGREKIYALTGEALSA